MAEKSASCPKPLNRARRQGIQENIADGCRQRGSPFWSLAVVSCSHFLETLIYQLSLFCLHIGSFPFANLSSSVSETQDAFLLNCLSGVSWWPMPSTGPLPQLLTSLVGSPLVELQSIKCTKPSLAHTHTHTMRTHTRMHICTHTHTQACTHMCVGRFSIFGLTS